MAHPTIQHARDLLASVDPDARFIEAYRGFIKSPPRKATDNDLHAWCLDRLHTLSGATSFTEAFEHQDVRTLLAFAYTAYAQHPELPSPRLARSMPVPKAASTLEADFLPALLTEIKAHAGLSAASAQNLKASEMRVSDLVTRLSDPAAVNFIVANGGGGGGGGGGHPSDDDLISALVFAGVLVLVLVTHK